jgi:hypothetical protein
MAIDPSRRHPLRERRPSPIESPQKARDRAGKGGAGRLELLVLRLRVIFGIAITTELALRQQGAERDVEIADCLRAGVSEPLAGEIERLGVLTTRERRIAAETVSRGRSRGSPGAHRSRRAKRRGSL